jgi:hypothetical protein
MNLKVFLCFCFGVIISLNANAQLGVGTSNIQLGAGWTSMGIESDQESTKGFIINGIFEKWLASQVGVGGSVHLFHGSQNRENDVTAISTSFPIYLNAKYYVGKENLKGFVRGSAGYQFSWRKKETLAEESVSDHDSGFTLGGGFGFVYTINPRILFNLEYSMYWMNNAFYADGFGNSVSLNIGYIISQ